MKNKPTDNKGNVTPEAVLNHVRFFFEEIPGEELNEGGCSREVTDYFEKANRWLTKYTITESVDNALAHFITQAKLVRNVKAEKKRHQFYEQFVETAMDDATNEILKALPTFISTVDLVLSGNSLGDRLDLPFELIEEIWQYLCEESVLEIVNG